MKEKNDKKCQLSLFIFNVVEVQPWLFSTCFKNERNKSQKKSL